MNTGNAGDVPSPLASQNGGSSNYYLLSTLVQKAARESNLLLAPHQNVARNVVRPEALGAFVVSDWEREPI